MKGKKFSTEVINEARRRHKNGESVAAIAKDLNAHPTTAYKWMKDSPVERVGKKKAIRKVKIDKVTKDNQGPDLEDIDNGEVTTLKERMNRLLRENHALKMMVADMFLDQVFDR